MNLNNNLEILDNHGLFDNSSFWNNWKLHEFIKYQNDECHIHATNIDFKKLQIGIKKLTLGATFDGKLEYLPNNLKTLILRYSRFNKEIKNLPDSLRNLIMDCSFNKEIKLWSSAQSGPRLHVLGFGILFNQKLTHLPSSLRVLSLGYSFKQDLNCCVALPYLQKLFIYDEYHEYRRYKLPLLFNTTMLSRKLTLNVGKL